MYIFSGSKVIAEYDNGAAPGSPSREYIYSDQALLAKIEAGATTYFHPDHLSNRVLSDSAGNVLGQRGHYPFGETWYEAGTTTKLKFTTYERDSESGNDYAMARTYVNRFGRFPSSDPIVGSTSDPQSLNRYTYGRNVPSSIVDPSGMHYGCLYLKNLDTKSSSEVAGGFSDDDADSNSPDPQGPCPPGGSGGGSSYVWLDGSLVPSSLIGSGESVIAYSGNGGLGGGWIADADSFGKFFNPLTGCYTNGSKIFCSPEAFAEAYPGSTVGFFTGLAIPSDPGSDPSGQGSGNSTGVCEGKVLSAVNKQFGTNFTNANVRTEFQFSTGAPPGQGTLNLNISGGGVSPGHYAVNWWTYIIGYGSTLHIPAGPGGLESPSTLVFSSSQFTAHLDSAFVYNPIGALFHLLIDVKGSGGYKPCP